MGGLFYAIAKQFRLLILRSYIKAPTAASFSQADYRR